MNAVKNDIEALVQKELKSANEHFPPFNSAHEGYAVLLEEIEELEEEVPKARQYFDFVWWIVRHSDVNSYCTEKSLDLIKMHAVNAAVEAVQVAAMCDKFKAMLRSDENG